MKLSRDLLSLRQASNSGLRPEDYQIVPLNDPDFIQLPY